MNDEEKYRSLRASLKALPKVKARAGFEDRLFQRIKQLEQGQVQQTVKPVRESKFKGWFANLFRPSLAPALGLTVILLVGVVVYFAYYSQINKESGPKQYSVTNSEQKPEFVIYVRKDTSNYASNYPHEYSGLTPGETQTSSSEFRQDVTKSPSDFNATTPSPSVDDRIHDDRISNEQRIEMQKIDTESKMDTKTEGKSDRKKDGFFKEEEKRMEKKAPSNYKSDDYENGDKNNNVSKGNDGTINQQNAPVNQDEIDSGKDNDNDSVHDKSGRGIPDSKKDLKKLSKSQLDSLKAKEKAPLNNEEPDSTKK